MSGNINLVKHPVLSYQVIPRLLPDGRETLCDGFKTHDANLLFRKDKEFFIPKKIHGSNFEHTRAQRRKLFVLIMFVFIASLRTQWFRRNGRK